MGSSRLNLKRLRVLVVDDNHVSTELMMQMLMGFRVQEAKACSTIADAKQMIDRQEFDLIIVDGELSTDDGVAVISYIRQKETSLNFTTPVLLVSANTPMRKVARARDAGANMVIRKPIAPAVILSRLEWLARIQREFVNHEVYRGPDRRFKLVPLPDDVEERRADALALAATPDRELSQNEVDSLFG